MSDLSKEEQVHVRAALAFLRARFGTWGLLSRALRAKQGFLVRVARGADPASASMAIRVARLGGGSVDALLAGTWPDPEACPHCGQRMPKDKRRAL